jgi:hypothetical protein
MKEFDEVHNFKPTDHQLTSTQRIEAFNRLTDPKLEKKVEG